MNSENACRICNERDFQTLSDGVCEDCTLLFQQFKDKPEKLRNLLAEIDYIGCYLTHDHRVIYRLLKANGFWHSKKSFWKYQNKAITVALLNDFVLLNVVSYEEGEEGAKYTLLPDTESTFKEWSLS